MNAFLASPERLVAAASFLQAVVEAQLEAYNARDLSAFLATYAEDAQLFEYPSKLLASGAGKPSTRSHDPLPASD